MFDILRKFQAETLLPIEVLRSDQSKNNRTLGKFERRKMRLTLDRLYLNFRKRVGINREEGGKAIYLRDSTIENKLSIFQKRKYANRIICQTARDPKSSQVKAILLKFDFHHEMKDYRRKTTTTTPQIPRL